jgi:hypothetical protein
LVVGRIHADAQQNAVPPADNTVEKRRDANPSTFRRAAGDDGQNRQRPDVHAKTHTGFRSSRTERYPRVMRTSPHQHLREEMMLIREGLMELTIAGKLPPARATSAIGSNELHNAPGTCSPRDLLHYRQHRPRRM